jgi:hypothetical protein
MEIIEERAFGEDGNMYPVGSERLLAVDLWERQLKKAGAVGWVDEHCEFRHIQCGRWALEWFATENLDNQYLYSEWHQKVSENASKINKKKDQEHDKKAEWQGPNWCIYFLGVVLMEDSIT